VAGRLAAAIVGEERRGAVRMVAEDDVSG
jgi:hypothetical protein